MILKYALAIPALIFAGWVVIQLVKRPVIGIAVTLICVILFDHYLMGPDSKFWQPNVYNNFNISTGISKAVFNPPEVMIGLIAVGWLAQATSGKLPGRPLMAISGLGIVWFICILVGCWWGIQQGGNFKIGLWLLRPAFYFLAIAFLTYQIVRNERQVAWFLGITIVCVVIKSIATIWIWKKYRHDHSTEWECYVSHEDTSFCIYVLWLAFGAFFMGSPLRLWITLLISCPPILLATVFNDRRINFVTLVLGCALLFISMPKGAIIRRGLWVAAGALAILCYIGFAIGGPENSLTRPVKGIISGLNSEVEGQNTDSSSQYRKYERYDLIHTIRAYPILGAGLGVEYLQPIPLPDLKFEYYVLIPHNQVLGTHALMGPFAYYILLLFYMSLFCQLLSFHRRLRTNWHRLMALAAAASVGNWLIVGWYDMQLFYFRNSLFMGVIVALPACLMRYQEEQDALLQTLPLEGTLACSKE